MSNQLLNVSLFIYLILFGASYLLYFISKGHIIKENNEKGIKAIIPIVGEYSLFRNAFGKEYALITYLFSNILPSIVIITFSLLINNPYILTIISIIPCVFGIYLRYRRNKILFNKCYGFGKIAAIFSVFFSRITFIIVYLFNKNALPKNKTPMNKSKRKALKSIASILLLSISLNSLVSIKSYAEPLEDTTEVITEEEVLSEEEQEDKTITEENTENYIPEEFKNIIRIRRTEGKNLRTLISNSQVGTDYDYIMYFPSSGHVPNVNDPIPELDNYGYNPNHVNILEYYGYTLSGDFAHCYVCMDCVEHQASDFTISESQKILSNANNLSNISDPNLRLFVKALCDANVIKVAPKEEESKDENVVKPQQESSENKGQAKPSENNSNKANNTVKPSEDKKVNVKREDLFEERKRQIDFTNTFLKCVNIVGDSLEEDKIELLGNIATNPIVEKVIDFGVDISGLELMATLFKSADFSAAMNQYAFDFYIGEITKKELAEKVSIKVADSISNCFDGLFFFDFMKDTVKTEMRKITLKHYNKKILKYTEDEIDRGIEKKYRLNF